MKKKIISVALLLVMLFSLASCGSAENMDAAKVFAKAQELNTDIKSMDATAKMDIGMDAAGQTFDMTTNMDMSVFLDPYKAKINTTVEMGAIKIQDIEMYMLDEGDKYFTYTGVDGEWIKQGMDKAIFEASMDGYDASAYLEALNESSEDFELEEVEEDSVKLYKASGTLTGESMKKLMESTNILDQLTDVGIDTSIYDDLGNLSITAYVDKKTEMLTKLTMDMTDMMQKMMESSMAEFGEDESVVINKCYMEMEYTSYNSSEDFELPAGAKDAEEMDLTFDSVE